MIHFCCFIKCWIDILESTKENDHLISDTLPYTHNCDGWKCLFRTVNKWLCTDSQMSKQCIQDSFRTVDIHPECGWQKFKDITLPELKPLCVFVFITVTIGAFRMLVQPMVMTGGGPDN